jgi:Zn finger protein HypA/HybF involved in hydrogenase expression
MNVARKPHTGEICTKPGLFECPHCGQTVRMFANPKDHYPPCPKCKTGVYYNEIFLNNLT